MTEDMGQHVIAQITELLKAKQVIVFGMDMPDNQYRELHWPQYGLTETNQIAVMVTSGSHKLPPATQRHSERFPLLIRSTI